MDFDNIRYSPGWFAKKFPGFYTEECYHILADYFKDNLIETRFVENKTADNTSRKRKLEEEEDGVEETKDVLPIELETLHQPLTDLEGVYRGRIYNPTVLLLKEVRVPEKVDAMISVNKVMMNQPDILDDFMTMNVTVLKTDGTSTSQTVQMKNIASYYTMKTYMNYNTDVTKSDNSIQLYLLLILNMLNSGSTTLAGTDLYKFTLGFSDALYSDNVTPLYFNYPPVTGATGTFTGVDAVVADMFNLFSNGRGYLKLLSKSATVASVTISGTCLKVLDLSPTTALTFSAVDTVVPIRVMAKGHDYFVIRCDQCRNTIDNMRPGTSADYSNVLGVIPCDGTQYICYNTYTTGSKMLLNGRSLDDIELFFEDKWGLPLYGMRDFYIELTLDFVNFKIMSDLPNMMSLKRQLGV
jgi:hypothetical protein